MLMPRLQLLLIGCWALIIGTAWPPAIEAQTSGGARTPLTAVITRDDLRESIDSWAKIESETLQVSFQKHVTVRVETDAAELLVKQYTDRSIPSNLTENRELSRFVVKMDLSTVLKRSFEVTVRSKYETLFRFLQSKTSEIAISARDISAALEDEDCQIIPCPPDKCKPDCSPEAFARFEKAPGLYPCAICAH